MEKRMRITRIKRNQFYNMKQSHMHERHEIYYLVSGERNFTINDKVFRIRKGDLVIIPAGDMHKTSCVDGNYHERVAIMFEDEVIEQIYTFFGRDYVRSVMESYIVPIPEGRRSYVEELMNRMIYESEGIDDISDYLEEAYFEELMLFIMRCFRSGRETDKYKLDESDEIIQQSAKYIFDNSEKNINLDDIAEKYGMSSSYFSKKFKNVMGFGFKEYLVSVRIKNAANLLLTTDRTITDIAISCGFNDSNYFGDCFRKIKGISPNKYRKNKGAI